MLRPSQLVSEKPAVASTWRREAPRCAYDHVAQVRHWSQSDENAQDVGLHRRAEQQHQVRRRGRRIGRPCGFPFAADGRRWSPPGRLFRRASAHFPSPPPASRSHVRQPGDAAADELRRLCLRSGGDEPGHGARLPLQLGPLAGLQAPRHRGRDRVGERGRPAHHRRRRGQGLSAPPTPAARCSFPIAPCRPRTSTWKRRSGRRGTTW